MAAKTIAMQYADATLGASHNAAHGAEMATMQGMGKMLHPGLPHGWVLGIWAVMMLVSFGVMLVPANGISPTRHLTLAKMPFVGTLIEYISASDWILRLLKLIFAALFLLIIAAGLFGTPIPERNAATVLTWNLWWSGLIVAVFFFGTAWCAVCPWDTIANFIVRRRMLGKSKDGGTSLNLRVPKALRTIWPALILFVGLTWLELGAGMTVDPYGTALVALAMVVLTVLSLALFERKAMCRFFCPVGRTIGFYSQLAPVELRPIDNDICARCTSLECYHGSSAVEPCPTYQVMGRMTQNTYCTSCGNCVRSCPDENVAWRLRSPSAEAVQDARPHWDEAWFMIGLLALTGFHGLTMLNYWEGAISALAQLIGDSGQLLVSFSIGFAVCLAVPLLFYAAAIWLVRGLNGLKTAYGNTFSRFAFVALPLAFAYHLAHNLNHLVREGSGLGALLANPFGTGTKPLTGAESHMRMMDMIVPENFLHALQAGLMALGFVIAVQVILRRGHGLGQVDQQRLSWSLAPLLVFTIAITGYHSWMLMQPMVMRF